MNLKVSDSFSSLNSRLNDYILKDLFSSSKENQVLGDGLQLLLLVLFLVLDLLLFDEVLDLLFDYSQVVVFAFLVLVLESHFFQEDGVGVCHVWEQ